MKLFLAALAFALVPPQADSLTLTVAKGTKLTISNSSSFEAELKNASIKVGGRELPPEVVEKFEMTMSQSSEEVVEDEYVAVEGTRAKGDGRGAGHGGPTRMAPQRRDKSRRGTRRML